MGKGRRFSARRGEEDPVVVGRCWDLDLSQLYCDRLQQVHIGALYKPLQITNFFYADLESATNSFSAESFLGKGSHGSVYREPPIRFVLSR